MKDLRTYLTGIGSSGALLAAVVVAFATLAGIVAFKGTPSSTEPRVSGSDVYVRADPSRTVPPARSGRPSGRAASKGAAPARRPDRAPGPAASSSAGSAAPTPVAEPVVPATGGPAPVAPDQPSPPPDPSPPVPPPPAPPPPTPIPSGNGDLSNLVNEVDETVAGATGIDPALGSTTKPITDPIDGAIGSLTGGHGLGVGDIDLPDPPKIIPGR